MNGASKVKISQSMPLAQYRLMGRILQGQQLSVANWREVGSMGAIIRKQFVTKAGSIWQATSHGIQRYHDQRPTVTSDKDRELPE